MADDKLDFGKHYPVVKGYFHKGNFYKDKGHSVEITGKSNTKYLDLETSLIYRWSWSKMMYVDFVYSSHLLSMGSANDIPRKYRQINVDENDMIVSGTITNALTCECSRMIYIGIYVDNSIFKIRKLDMLSGKFSFVVDIPKASIGNYYIGGMLVDDNYIYLTNASTHKTIYRINLDTKYIDSFVSVDSFYCNGKMVWVDNKTIAIANNKGFILFDTTSCQYTPMLCKNTHSSEEMSVGSKLIMTHSSGNTNIVSTHSILDGECVNITLPTSTKSVSCYYEGKFYIAHTNYLRVIDEETKTIETSFSIPWSNPKTIDCTNGMIFVTQNNKNELYIYDIKNNVFRTVILPWTIPSINVSGITRPTAVKGYYFLPCITMAIINYSESTKYNMGYKFNQYAFIFNSQEEPKFEYDDRFVTFMDSHMTIHDGTIIPTLEIVDDDTHIKKFHISKSEYTKLKSIKYEQIPEVDDQNQ